jgi:hypothetical protein
MGNGIVDIEMHSCGFDLAGILDNAGFVTQGGDAGAPSPKATESKNVPAPCH